MLNSLTGLTQELDSINNCSDSNTYSFSEEQVRELLKSAYELDECNKLYKDLSDIVDKSQFKIRSLDNLIHDKNKYIYKQDKKIKRIKLTRNISIGVGILTTTFFLLK